MHNGLTDTLVDILIPPLCVSCKKEGDFVCENCLGDINIYKYFVCPICRKRIYEGTLDKKCAYTSGLKRFLGAPLPYTDKTTKKLLLSLKYSRVKSLVHPLSQILIQFLERNGFSEIIEKNRDRLTIAPIPLYNFRERERGFNQSYEIAKYIGEYYKIPVEKLLRKNRNTLQQAELEQKEKRFANVLGAFSVADTSLVKGKIIILIDDVYTTGATMSECARTLRAAGAKEVWGMTVARGA